MNETRTGSIGGALASLRRDRRGNTLAMAAASLIPIVGMVGSGLDASRTYLAKTRLQSACDAGALAARKVMDGSGTLTTTATTAGTTFFENNFPTGTYGTTNRTFATSLGTAKQVVGTASVRVPMTLMKTFNYNYIDLNVTCAAQLDIPNTDVMFVLDTTGSMNCAPADTDATCADNGLVEKSDARIKGLRAAVLDFTNTLSTAAPTTARIRYGFVSYSTTVNVGALLQPSWVSSTWNYRSRSANFTSPSPWYATRPYSSAITSAECTRYGNTVGYPGTTGGATTTSGPDAGGFRTTTSVSFNNYNSTNGTCVRNETTSVSPQAYRWNGTWTYGSISTDASSYKAGNSVQVAIGNPGANDYSATSRSYNPVELAALATYTGAERTSTWNKCIEERKTLPSATFTYSSSFPGSAYDLDLDTVPSSTDTTWRAQWADVVWNGTTSYANINANYAACPAAAKELFEYPRSTTQADVTTYVNSLKAVGFTYHDTGMIWGGRLLSPDGVFASAKAVPTNNQAVSRNIVFMTDGAMKPDTNVYSLYGLEALDQRVTGGTPTNADLLNRHNSRFVAICNAIRAKNIKIYVVGFAQALTSELTQCADPGQAYYASDTTTLQKTFRDIATQIAKLRLSQ